MLQGKNRYKPLRWLAAMPLIFTLLNPSTGFAAGCQTGAEALANAYLRFNPIFAHYFGDLESYVSQNRSHFVSDGDAVVCASRAAQAWAQGAFNNFDPGDRARRDRINAELGTMGISPGESYSSPAADLYFAARQMDKMAYALPYAANGNYQPMYQPRNEIEQMQILAMQLFAQLIRDPSIAYTFEQLRPLMVELGNIEYRMVLGSISSL